MNKNQKIEALKAQICLEEAEERLRKAGLDILAMKVRVHIDTLSIIRLHDYSEQLCGEKDNEN